MPTQRPGQKPKVSPSVYAQYTVLVSQTEGKGFCKELVLSKEGRFSAELQPGEYTLTVRAKKGMMNPPKPKKVIVMAGKTTHIRFVIDTGIR